MDSKRNQEDRLSSLPDPLLLHILSFLPTTEAVKTMVIKPFGNLWTSLPNLNLHSSFFCWDDNGDNEPSTTDLQMVRFARNLLMRHRNPKIDKFSVRIYEISHHEIDYHNLGPEIDSWINFALGKQVEVLEFYVLDPDGEPYVLPHSILISDSLVHLKFEWVNFYLQRRVQMRSLQILRLIVVKISDQLFREIISGCTFLMELEIDSCWVFNELNIDAPNLEVLKLDMGDCEDHIPRINCPNLRSFDFIGLVRVVEVINLSCLVDLTLHFKGPMNFQEPSQVIAVLEKVVHAKVVSLSDLSTMVLFYCMQKDHQNLSTKWKQLELNIWLLTDGHITGICRLLRSSPDVEELVLNVEGWYITIEPIELEADNQILERQQSWSSLKRVIIRGNLKSSHVVVVHLVEILLKNASVLHELVIFCKGNVGLTSHQQMEFSEKLLRFPRSSKHATVLLS